MITTSATYFHIEVRGVVGGSIRRSTSSSVYGTKITCIDIWEQNFVGSLGSPDDEKYL